ncbi:metallopeptidase family M24-domain-containing protein [Annulohypoxylon moriforme]|nr:metallopeptidase family M24-domain-containing protein [Annulohypoxylon moriforme]
MPSPKMDPHTHNHNFRDHVKCRTKHLLQSAVSAAVAVALTIPFISKLPLTDVARRSVEVNNVAELEAKDGEGPKRYPAKHHARKVAKELGTDNGLIYLPGQLESTWEDSDQGPPFRQRRYFYYLTGADFPGCSVTYDIAADKLTLWVPFTPPATILWFGNTPSPDDCLSQSDVHDVKYVGELAQYLSARLATVKTLYALRPSQLPKFEGFEQMRPSLKIDVSSLQPAMDEARLIKSDYEVAMIKRANDISSAAHRAVAKKVAAFKNECEVEAAFIAGCTAANAKTQAYPVIAGSGPNASTLHYGSNNETLIGRQLLVLDAGAEWSCYASEVTRTLPIGPRSQFTREARAVYELVHRMQAECIARIKPGVVFRDLQLHATLVAVEGLLELGVLKGGTAEEIFRNGTGAAFFPHGLGHHVGLDVHELVSSSLFTAPITPFKPVPFLSSRPEASAPPFFCQTRDRRDSTTSERSGLNMFPSVLSRDLLRPAGEGMWGKRRPIGPQSVRAMIKQAAAEAPPSTSPSSTTMSSGISHQQPQQQQITPPNSQDGTAPPLPPRSIPSPIPEAAPSTPQPSSPASSKNNSPTRNAPPRTSTSSPPFAPPMRTNTITPAQLQELSQNHPPAQLQPQRQASQHSHHHPHHHQQSQNQNQQSQQQSSQAKRGSVSATNGTADKKNANTNTPGGKRAMHNTLQPQMIVTVEPGVYFCKPYIEAYFLRREEHARYIDPVVLDKYWGVGGVRVEDCVLVTENACEVLTTAPKGNELLRMMGYA